ncbi:reverse transcriptase domain-containing protein [Tanacetum coccineum]
MGIVVSTIHAAVKLHTPCDIGNVFLTYEPNNIEKGQKKIKESVPEATKDVLSCINAEERIVVNDKHPKQMVIIGKQLPTSFKRKLFQIKCFLDAYKGYHHIQREKGDEDKTTIFTEKVLCYGKMPFGLKNAGATYQRRLRRYFHAHSIRVLTDKPIKQILIRPKKWGRIAKWIIDLGEHDIEFKGRNSVKGKILADFLAKTPFVEDNDTKTKNPVATNKAPTLKNIWKLYTDEASSSDGSGVGLMLVSPEGKEFTYALRFEFKITNNEAEFETLLTGLRTAMDMEIKDLAIFVDSKLVANQVKGLFEARQPEDTHALLKELEMESLAEVELRPLRELRNE